jgi:hypothetical protein
VLQLEFAEDRTLRQAQFVPMVQRPTQGPAPDPEGAAIGLVQALSTEDFGPTGALVSSAGEISPPPSAAQYKP